ncbi:EamA family transporter [Patescibacteria group bacterium]
MNQGFYLALAAGFLWSVTNIIDKAVVNRFIKSPALLTLIFSVVLLIAGLVMLPPSSEWMTGTDFWWMVVSGFLYMIATLWYFFALQKEEASRVVPLFALTIVFLTLQSAIFLGEVFTLTTYIGIGLVIVASFILMSRRNILDAFQSKVFAYMIASTFAYALSYVINKDLLATYTDKQVFSFHNILIGFVGMIFLLFFIRKMRLQYSEIKKRYISVSVMGEIISALGAFLFIAASAVWFVTLVETVVSVQYVFLFIFTIIISRFAPNLFKEEINRNIIIQKSIAIVLMIIGIYLIS